MSIIATTLIFLILSGLIAIIIVILLKKDVPGFKIMLLGLNITLVGGIIAADPGSSLDGIEYFIVLLGLIVSIAGLVKRDQTF